MYKRFARFNPKSEFHNWNGQSESRKKSITLKLLIKIKIY